ncbi:Uncharacterised protein [Serratia quinivorans]|uniref:winged helix-turn-helix domain-containing protein n=1 Tax=Serratia quinivorans TaxID=137545 RepID=UPI002177DF2F|nr:hypothetical protein [Serratia quinivorans]CAI1927314.1 Uncharacterised protein [Serratia quinivorans]
MLTINECQQILGDNVISWENHLFLECRTNKLFFNNSSQHVMLNENQKRLLTCLFKNINCKRKIINIVWYENHQKISDNNYHQLVFKLRVLFQKNDIASDLIITIPYYGLKLNESITGVKSCENNEFPGVRAQKKLISMLSRTLHLRKLFIVSLMVLI